GHQHGWRTPVHPASRRPAGFEARAPSASAPTAASAHDDRRLNGVQWHPEVKHSAHGQAVLETFLHRAAGIPGDWNSGNVIAARVQRHRAPVGDAKGICGRSGGVHSADAVLSGHREVGDPPTCGVVVDR
ncbi:glutamine amidotransferase-related protein, partial [Clavibacter michiganensis]